MANKRAIRSPLTGGSQPKLRLSLFIRELCGSATPMRGKSQTCRNAFLEPAVYDLGV